MPVFNNILAGAAGSGGAAGYKIDRSLRFNNGDSAHLSQDFSAGNRKTWTWSSWFKPSKLDRRNYIFTNYESGGQNALYFEFTDENKIRVGEYTTSWVWRLDSTAKFRDLSAWYHLVLVVDTTQSTAANRVKVYVNGEQLTSFSPADYPTQNKATFINQNINHTIGRLQNNYADFYLADVHFIDGQALAATDFGELDDNNVWQPKKYQGSYNGSATGTMYSGMLTSSSGFQSGYGAVNIFDGSLSTSARNINNNDNYIEFTPTTPISFTNGVQVHCYAANGYSITNYWSVDLDGNGLGSETTFVGGGSNFNGSAWIDVATGSGTLHKLRIRLTRSGSQSGAEIFAIAINGSSSSSNYLLDGSPAGVNGFHLDFSDNSSDAALGTDSSGNNNTWTVNNLTAFAPTTATITHARIYAVYSGGTRGANYNVDYSDNGTTWTTAFTGNMTASACGLITGTGVGDGTYGAHKYWRYVIGTATDDHHPNAARYVLSDGTVDYNVKVHYPDNCNDQGSFQSVDRVLTLPTNLEGIDSLIDTPTNYEANSGNNGGNYATWNPLDVKTTIALSNGNLDLVGSTDGRTRATLAMPSGKWYWEIQVGDVPASNHIGIWATNVPISNDTYRVIYRGDGYWIVGGSAAQQWSSVSKGDIVGITFDASTLETKFYKNNSLLGTKTAPALPSGSAYTPAVILAGSNSSLQANFGARPFAYTPPTGFKSLCTTNLPDPTIADPSTAFDTKLYTGNGTSQTISGYNFSPDFAWFKSRNGTDWHALVDTVRGKTKVLFSNEYDDEETRTEGVSSFNSDGFSLGDYAPMNKLNDSFVSWAWDAGTSNTSISAGSIRAASTVSSGNAYSVGWAGTGTNTWSNTDSWSGLSAVSNNGKGYFSGTENLSDGSQISVANGSFAAGNNGSNGWVLRASSTVTIDFTAYSNITEIATTSSDSQTFADRTIVATNPPTGSSVVATGKCFWFKNASQMSVSHINIVNDAPASPSIASTVRANPSAGFSIITYTGTGSNATIGHGLNAAPGLVIVKKRSAAGSWTVWHEAFGTASNTDYIYLDSTSQQAQNGSDAQPFWNNTVPSSNVVSLGTGGNVNGSSATFVAYCFAPVAGYSSFGSYTGNGLADGAFVYTGFKPRWIMIKRTNVDKQWVIMDTKRDPHNVSDTVLVASNTSGDWSNVENDFDILSNGFKMRNAHDSKNGSGDTYIYAAFGDPFKTARAR